MSKDDMWEEQIIKNHRDFVNRQQMSRKQQNVNTLEEHVNASSTSERLDELNHIGDGRILATKAELTKLIEEETTKARIDELEYIVAKARSKTPIGDSPFGYVIRIRLAELTNKEKENTNE